MYRNAFFTVGMPFRTPFFAPKTVGSWLARHIALGSVPSTGTRAFSRVEVARTVAATIALWLTFVAVHPVRTYRLAFHTCRVRSNCIITFSAKCVILILCYTYLFWFYIPLYKYIVYIVTIPSILAFAFTRYRVAGYRVAPFTVAILATISAVRSRLASLVTQITRKTGLASTRTWNITDLLQTIMWLHVYYKYILLYFHGLLCVHGNGIIQQVKRNTPGILPVPLQLLRTINFHKI